MPDLTAAALADVVRAGSYRWGTERQLQDGLEDVFAAAGVPVQREYRLPDGTGRLDFLAGDDVAIEVKIDGTVSALAWQLFRYAASEHVREILVVTTRRIHRNMPGVIDGKPVVVYQVGGLS